MIPLRRPASRAVAVAIALATLAVPAAAAAQSATSTSIAASPSPATAGQPVTLTATTSAPGTVTFTYGGQTVGTAPTAGAAATASGFTQWQYTDNSVGHRIATNPASSNLFVSTYNPSDCGGGRCQTKQLSPGGGVTYAPLESWNGLYVSVTGLAVDSSGAIYEGIFNGSAQNTIRKRTSIGAASTEFVSSTSICGTCSGGSNYITGMTIDANDNLYVTNSREGRILKITPAGVVSVYASGLGSPIAGPVINRTTGVLYYIDGSGDIKQIPAGGGTPTLLAAASCNIDANPASAWYGNGAQLALDSAGVVYGAQCGGVTPASTPNAEPITQINPTTGAMRQYMSWATCLSSPPLPGLAAGCGGVNALAFVGDTMYTATHNMGVSAVIGMVPSGYVATLTYTPPAAGSYATGASLAPTNSGAYAGSSGSGTLVVGPAAPSTPDLATSSDTGSSTSDNTTSDNTPLIEVPGTYATGNTITVTATKSGSANVTCTYVIPATGCSLGTLADGTWSITATDTHPTGGTSSASGALSITVDTAAPSAPSAVDLAAASDSGSSSTDNATNDATPTLSASGGTAGDTMTLTATNGTTTVTCSYVLPAANCTMPTMADGTWSVTATLTDAAGNTSAASSPLSVRIDTTGPGALTPDLLAASDLGPSSTDDVTSDNTPTITIPGQATGDVITITAAKSGSTSVTCSYTVGASTGCTLGTLADGTWTVSASVTDLAGNTGTTLPLPITIDTSAPTAPAAVDLATASDLGASATDNATSDNTPTMSAAGGSDGDTVTITATKGASTVSCTYVVPAASCDLGTLSDGTWNVSATFTDPAGNTSAPSPALPVAIDTVPPSAPAAPDLAAASDTGSSATDNLTSDTTPRIDVPGGTAGDTITVTATPVGGGTPVTCTFVVGAATGCDLGPLADGQWATSATATDPAGNTGPATAGPTLSIDATSPTGPATPTLDPASDTGSSNSDRITADTTPTMHVPGVPSGETITLNATGPNGQTASCTFVASATVDSCDLGPLADGRWSVTASSNATDDAGNQAAPSAPMTIDIAATPPSAPSRPKPTGDTEADSAGRPQTMDTTPRFTVPGASAPNTITLNAVGPGGLTASCSYVPSETVTSCTLGPLADGLWTVTPTQTSPAGVTGPAGPPYTIRIGPEPKRNAPPDPYKVDVERQTNGYGASAWFAVPVNPDTVDAVVFTIRDRNGAIIRQIIKRVTGRTDRVRIRIDTLPKGAKVTAHTINRHGVSPRAPRYANLRNVDTRRNRTMLPNGGYALRGAAIGDAVLFAGASDVLTPEAKRILDRVAAIAERRGGELLITGFARRNGINSDGWLLRLSKRRAENVARYLADRGVTGWISWNGVGAATPYIGTPDDRNVQVNWISGR